MERVRPDKIKEQLQKASVLVPPKVGIPLLLYLAILEKAMGCMLGQKEDLGRE